MPEQAEKKVIKLTLTQEAYADLVELAKYYGTPPTTLARVWVCDTIRAQRDKPGLPPGTVHGNHPPQSGSGCGCSTVTTEAPKSPGMDHATPAQSTLSEIKKEKEKNANHVLSLVSEQVIGYMNKAKPRTNGAKGWSPEVWLPKFKALEKAGYTIDDFMEVVKWREGEARSKGDWTWFKPDTLFRSVQKFAEYLDNARACVTTTQPTQQDKPRDDRNAFWYD